MCCLWRQLIATIVASNCANPRAHAGTALVTAEHCGRLLTVPSRPIHVLIPHPCRYCSEPSRSVMCWAQEVEDALFARSHSKQVGEMAVDCTGSGKQVLYDISRGWVFKAHR